MGLCQYVDLCLHALFLYWFAYLLACHPYVYIFNVSLVSVLFVQVIMSVQYSTVVLSLAGCDNTVCIYSELRTSCRILEQVPTLYQIGHLTDQDKYFDPKYVVRS